MTDEMDNSTAITHVIETGDLEEARSILGDREKIRYAGIIRAGVKVPKNTCTPQEKAKFKELEAQGLPYDEIDTILGGKPKTATSKLFPTNVDFFVIRDCDFRRPGDAAYIREHYKDPDGKVRRIPIWLTKGEIEAVIPHNFRAFGGDGSLRCVSFYDGDDLKFKYLPKDVKSPKAEDWRVLDSDDEEEATKACGYKVQFGGLYKVNVPGLRGLGEILVPTRSWYGMGDAVGQLKGVRGLLGRFDGLLDGNPFLELCKVQETVKDPSGKKVKQWLITIELSVDPMELARHAAKTLERGKRSLALFNGEKTEKPVEQKPEPKTETLDLPNYEELKRAGDAIVALVARADITRPEIDAYAKLLLGATLGEQKDIVALRKFFVDIRKELAEDPATVRARCQRAFNGGEESTTLDPEVEAMIQEICNLAEKYGLDEEHILAHLTITSGADPEDQSVQELQQAYREIEARCEKDLDVFINEIEQDHAMVQGE
jgi:hypothetical protein